MPASTKKAANKNKTEPVLVTRTLRSSVKRKNEESQEPPVFEDAQISKSDSEESVQQQSVFSSSARTKSRRGGRNKKQKVIRDQMDNSLHVKVEVDNNLSREEDVMLFEKPKMNGRRGGRNKKLLVTNNNRDMSSEDINEEQMNNAQSKNNDDDKIAETHPVISYNSKVNSRRGRNRKVIIGTISHHNNSSSIITHSASLSSESHVDPTKIDATKKRTGTKSARNSARREEIHKVKPARGSLTKKKETPDVEFLVTNPKSVLRRIKLPKNLDMKEFLPFNEEHQQRLLNLLPFVDKMPSFNMDDDDFDIYPENEM
ncbi:1105_t:CDS:2, partial [Ambispora leptoticha]